MERKYEQHECCCECHRKTVTHPTRTCDCGKPIKHPKATCPPPEPPCEPGLIDFEQPPPFHAPTSPETPGAKTRPPKGDLGEINWFRNQIRDASRKGPTFGPRKDEYLPYLLVRTTAGDRGARRFSGVFWESPDIFVAPNLTAETAPLLPPTSGGVARANAPNTLYAHVWNLGKAPAYRVRVEFYWFNPSLGISRATGHLIGAAHVDLSNRFSQLPNWTPAQDSTGTYLTRGSHEIVRCPTTWVPTFENNGHECLVVRIADPLMDSLPPEQFSPLDSRKVAQRNIAVVEAQSPAVIDLPLELGYAASPGEAELVVDIDPPSSMEWLKLYTQQNNPGFAATSAKVVAGFLPPTPVGLRTPSVRDVPFDDRQPLLSARERFYRGCDPLQVAFHASIEDLNPNQASVVRVRQKVGGEVTGGYTVVLLRK